VVVARSLTTTIRERENATNELERRSRVPQPWSYGTAAAPAIGYGSNT